MKSGIDEKHLRLQSNDGKRVETHKKTIISSVDTFQTQAYNSFSLHSKERIFKSEIFSNLIHSYH